MNDFTYRQLLQRSWLALLSATLPTMAAAAERGKRLPEAPTDGDGDDAPEVASASFVRQNRSPSSVQKYYVRRVREVMHEADAFSLPTPFELRLR